MFTSGLGTTFGSKILTIFSHVWPRRQQLENVFIVFGQESKSSLSG